MEEKETIELIYINIISFSNTLHEPLKDTMPTL